MLAERELERRLEEVEVERYGYRAMASPPWPFPVHSVDRLLWDLPRLDLLIVGGGQIVRFDTGLPHGFTPADPTLHHPTALWLIPTLAAAAHNVPVAWNAVGVSQEPPPWAHPLVIAALRSVSLLTVRDEPSALRLRAVDSTCAVNVVPDTAFGIQRSFAGDRSDAFPDFLNSTGLTPPYAFVQPSPNMTLVQSQANRLLQAARRAGMDVLELPIGPCNGDRLGLLDLDVQHCSSELIPHDPLLAAEVIANAEAVIGDSFHLGVVALSHGVPVHRPRGPAGSKYEILDGADGVNLLDTANSAEPRVEKSSPSGWFAAEQAASVSAHWDAVASLALGEHQRTGVANLAIASLLSDLPGLLDRQDETASAHDTLATLSETTEKNEREFMQLSSKYQVLVSSRSWRLTRPLRRVMQMFRPAPPSARNRPKAGASPASRDRDQA